MSGGGAWCVGGRSSKGAGKAAVGWVRGARGRLRAASILAMAAGAVTTARTVSLPPQRSDAHAKVDVEGALQEGTPIEPRARGVELAVEEAIPVGERDRRSARRGGLYDAGRRQGPCRDECVEHEGRAPIARFERFERTRSRRRGRGARRRHATDGAARRRHENVRAGTSEGARWRQDSRVPRYASSRAGLPGRAWPSSRGTRRCRRGVRGGARARRPAG